MSLTIPLMPDLLGPAQRLPRYLCQSEVSRFFEAIPAGRDRLLFGLIYLYGLRVGEVALLRVGDIDLERSRILIRRLKGGAWSERPIFRSLENELAAQLNARVSDPGLALFPGRAGPLRKRQIQALFERYRDRAGLPRSISCHCLRHSIATHLLDAGVALEFVQDHLGHQSIRSTSIYARITDHRRVEVFRQLEASPWIVQPESLGSANPSAPGLKECE